jgi:hypothetical protein
MPPHEADAKDPVLALSVESKDVPIRPADVPPPTRQMAQARPTSSRQGGSSGERAHTTRRATVAAVDTSAPWVRPPRRHHAGAAASSCGGGGTMEAYRCRSHAASAFAVGEWHCCGIRAVSSAASIPAPSRRWLCQRYGANTPTRSGSKQQVLISGW